MRLRKNSDFLENELYKPSMQAKPAFRFAPLPLPQEKSNFSLTDLGKVKGNIALTLDHERLSLMILLVFPEFYVAKQFVNCE